MGPKTPFASVACAATVSGFPRVPAATGWCVSCGGSPSSGTTGSTVWMAADGAEDFFLRLFFEVFLAPPFLLLLFFFDFAGGFALASGWDGAAASDWAIAAAAKHRLAAAITNSLRRCMRFVPGEGRIDLTRKQKTVNQSTSRLRCCKAGRSRRT